MIAAVLEELEDWKALASGLNIARATTDNINKNCPSFSRTLCQWRELIYTYCDTNAAGDPYKTATDIADILDRKMGKRRQAQYLKQLQFTSEFENNIFIARTFNSCTESISDVIHLHGITQQKAKDDSQRNKCSIYMQHNIIMCNPFLSLLLWD